MTSSADSNATGTTSSFENCDHLLVITELLKKVSDEELAKVHNQVIEEEKQRLTRAEKALECMREVFRRPEPASATLDASRFSTKTNNSTTLANPARSKGKASPKGGRASRGKAKELILAFLEDSPKSRKQITSHFKENKLSTNSIGTLLNRLKNDNIIVHNEEGKLYSIMQNKAGSNDSSNGRRTF